MTTKLQEFRNKIYFTDSKMKEIAELVEQAEGVTEEISNVQSKLTRIDGFIDETVELINQSIEDGNVKLAKQEIKSLKDTLNKLVKDGTFQVVSKAADVLEKLYEELD